MQTKKIIFLLCCTVLVSGCSSINLRIAQELADNGSSSTLDISESYSKRSDELEIYLEGEYILAGLKEDYSVPGKIVLAKVDSVKKEMLQRKELFSNFAKVYQAFAELALFEDSENVETSLRGLTSAVNDYSKLSKGKVYFSKTDEDIAAITGRKLFDAYHDYKVKKASKMIRERLIAAKELLAKQSEKSAVISMEHEIDRNRLKVAMSLWNNGLGLPTKIIEEHIETYGLQVNKKETLRQIDKSTNGNMKKAIENVMRFRHERKLRARKDSYNASINALQLLINAHIQLEKGESISFENLKKVISTVNEYTKLVTVRKEEE